MSEPETPKTDPESPDTAGAAENAATSTAEPEAEAAEKLRQEVDIRDAGPCRKHIKVTVNRDDIDERIDEHFSKLILRDHAQVPGFRPGKAPRKVVERRFQKDVHEQVRSEVLMASLEQIAEDYDVAPLAPPNIDPAKIDIPDSGPMIYEFEVEVRPQFDLPNYKGITLKRPTMTFTEADVDRELRRLLEQHGQIVPKGDKAIVEIGDFIVADMVASLDGNVVNTVQETQLRVDPRLALRDGVAEKFGEQTKGAKAGDKREVDILLSDAVAEASMRGRTVKAMFTIKEVKMLRLPELNEELLDQFGVHTVEAFREKVRVILNRRLQYQQEQSYRRQILDLIVEASKWELPRDLLMRQARRAFNRRIMEMRNAGMTDDEILARQRVLERDVLNSTANALKEHFVLQKIAEVEKIEIEDADIDAEIERIAEANDMSPRRLRAQLEREDMMETLAVELIERKALDLIMENAVYEDVPLTPSQEDTPVGTTDVQTVHGEVKDPTAPPPEEKPAEEEK
jgi:trigger factor